MKASAREKGWEIHASQYFRVIVLRAFANSLLGNRRAVAANSGPVTLPRIVQAATLTCGLLRMRLAFPDVFMVITYSFSSCSPNQIGVATPTPLFRNVVSETYFWFWIADGIGLRIIYFRRSPYTPDCGLAVAVDTGSLAAPPIAPVLPSVLQA
jgi:hypothetical protein